MARVRVWPHVWVGMRFSREVRARCARMAREAGRGFEEEVRHTLCSAGEKVVFFLRSHNKL